MKVDETVIRHLSYLCRTYDGTAKLLTSTKNRLHAMSPDAEAKHQDEVQFLDSFKNKLSRKIEKELAFWPVWTEWMEGIPGVGPFIAGNLILLYYYRFTPICPKCESVIEKKDKTFWCPGCEKSMRGDGLTTHRIDVKDFADISSWWHYCGRHIVAGKMPKRQKGKTADWSNRGRLITYQFSDQVNRRKPDHPYKAFLLERKKKREKTHPKATKGHRLNMAKNETAKLFLAHFWTVARTLDGLPVTKPYAGTILGHTGIIDPFYFDLDVAA